MWKKAAHCDPYVALSALLIGSAQHLQMVISSGSRGGGARGRAPVPAKKKKKKKEKTSVSGQRALISECSACKS